MKHLVIAITYWIIVLLLVSAGLYSMETLDFEKENSYLKILSIILPMGLSVIPAVFAGDKMDKYWASKRK
jgi:hypothetical protein